MQNNQIKRKRIMTNVMQIIAKSYEIVGKDEYTHLLIKNTETNRTIARFKTIRS